MSVLLLILDQLSRLPDQGYYTGPETSERRPKGLPSCLVVSSLHVTSLAGNDNEFPNASRSDVEAGLEVLRRAGAPLLAHAELVSHVDVQVQIWT